MSEDKFVVKDSCGDGYELEFAYGIVDLIDKNDNGHVVTEFDEDDFPHTGKWISVKDELPPDQEEVLVCTLAKNGVQNIDKGYWAIDHFIHRGRSQVTHWMPLPELPEEVAQ